MVHRHNAWDYLGIFVLLIPGMLLCIASVVQLAWTYLP